MTVYIYTPEQHAQIVDALELAEEAIHDSYERDNMKGGYQDATHRVIHSRARETLKAMQPVSPCAWGWHGGDGRMRDCIAPDTHAILEGDYTVPLYTPTKD